MSKKQISVLGEPIEPCGRELRTGFFRDCLCRSDSSDFGRHLVCAIMTEEFLAHSMLVGNNLSRPVPENMFPGLKPGDKWCLCAANWLAACKAGCAPPVCIRATHRNALDIIPLDLLRKHACDLN